MRLAMFAQVPRHNAATRAFCERPLPYLRERGIDARLFVPSEPAPYRRLVDAQSALHRLLAALYWFGLVLPRRLVQLAQASRADAIFVQRSLLHGASLPVLEILAAKLIRLRGGILLYHLDDALYLDYPRRYATRAQVADWVLTGNSAISSWARDLGARVWMFDGPVDVDRYPASHRANHSPPVIGWTGVFPETDLDPILPALSEVCERRGARVKVVSGRRYSRSELDGHLEWEQWSLEHEYDCLADADIAIAPLADTSYNRGREAFKIKEYMAAGLPVVCSPVGHNARVVRHGENGLHATDADEWIRALIRLIDDPTLRARMGASGQRLAQTNYALSSQAAKLADFLRTAVKANARRGSENAT